VKAIVYYSVASIWLLLCAIVGIGIHKQTPRQILKDKAFIDEQINLNVQFIKNFKKQHNRLPTVEEFNESNRSSGAEYIRDKKTIPDEIQEEVETFDWETEYALAVWRGEWNEYYLSRGDRYITNNYSYQDGIQGMVILLLIGLVPIGILIITKRKRPVPNIKQAGQHAAKPQG
jgi:hypothetical protein